MVHHHKGKSPYRTLSRRTSHRSRRGAFSWPRWEHAWGARRAGKSLPHLTLHAGGPGLLLSRRCPALAAASPSASRLAPRAGTRAGRGGGGPRARVRQGAPPTAGGRGGWRACAAPERRERRPWRRCWSTRARSSWTSSTRTGWWSAPAGSASTACCCASSASTASPPAWCWCSTPAPPRRWGNAVSRVAPAPPLPLAGVASPFRRAPPGGGRPPSQCPGPGEEVAAYSVGRGACERRGAGRRHRDAGSGRGRRRQRGALPGRCAPACALAAGPVAVRITSRSELLLMQRDETLITIIMS